MSKTDLKNLLVFTHVQGGLGDIATASKIIDFILQNYFESVDVYWVLDCGSAKIEIAQSMLSNTSIKRIKCVRSWYTEPSNPDITFDLLVETPCLTNWSHGYLGRKLRHDLNNCKYLRIAEAGTVLFNPNINEYLYFALGLTPANGVLFRNLPIFDTQQIEDKSLSRDLSDIIARSDGDFSLNCGYAHHGTSRLDFLDCVLLHEREKKNIVIVLNQNGEFANQSFDEIAEQLLRPNRLDLIEKSQVTSIYLSAPEEKRHVHYLGRGKNGNSRILHVILRPNFSYNDMGIVQAGSDRFLVTGNNSTFDAWSSGKCVLYFYEDVANAGVTGNFLQEQVDRLAPVSKEMSRLISIFGRDQRLDIPRGHGKCLIDDENYWDEIRNLLSGESLDVNHFKIQDWLSILRRDENFLHVLKLEFETILNDGAKEL